MRLLTLFSVTEYIPVYVIAIIAILCTAVLGLVVGILVYRYMYVLDTGNIMLSRPCNRWFTGSRYQAIGVRDN